MNLDLNRIGQIAISVTDVDRAERFYGEVLGLRKLYRFGDLTFFDCTGVLLLVVALMQEAPKGCHPPVASG